MQMLKSTAYGLGVLSAIGLLAGCSSGAGGGSSLSAVPAVLVANADRVGLTQLGAATRAGGRGSWMAPDAAGMNLLYVADLNAGSVNVYSYPTGTLKGVLTGFSAPHYECVDKAGNVFVASSSAKNVLEYAHGGKTPIKTFKVTGYPHGCAIDPTTGNLAILQDPPTSGPGQILIYAHAKGKPTQYTTPNVFRVYFLGYDANGNLFVDGTDMHVAFEFAELPAGSQTAIAVTLNQNIVLPGAIQWDGKNLAVGDQVSIAGPSVIYEFTIAGTTGTKVGTTPLTNSCDVLQFWIQNKRVIVANDCSHDVMYFNYPVGGASTKTITDSLKEPVGVAVSVK